MLKSVFRGLLLVCIVGAASATSQQRSTTPIWSSLEDGSIVLSVDKPVYFPGDTVRLAVRRNDSSAMANVNPILTTDGTMFKYAGSNTYFIVLPETVMPGSYHVGFRLVDDEGRRFVYETNCIVEVEEYHSVERIDNYASIEPEAGSKDPLTAEVLDRKHIRNLHVIFHRDSIHEHMGPQFIMIGIMVQSKQGTIVQTYERRVMTFRSRGGPNHDLAMFLRYRKAYGAYALIRPEELEQVQVEVDSLPDWAIVKVSVEPDYTITIGEVDKSNSVTQYFRVEGPAIELGFTLGIPKVLYDTQARDTVEYGNTSAMIRFYYFDGTSGERFPVDFGIGTFGVNSPIDMSAGRGGFAVSMFLDIVEFMKRLDIGFPMRVNAGLELVPFFPIDRRSRLLLNAQVGLSL
jgi:hypothetical protein